MGIPLQRLIAWDPGAGTGLLKEGCCGYRYVARCAGCGHVHPQDEMGLLDGAPQCARCLERPASAGPTPPDPTMFPHSNANRTRQPMTIPETDPDGAQRLVEEENARIVDVREPFEWGAGHIPGATHISLSDIASRLHELPRDVPLVLQCRSGNRSGQAARYLVEAGFTRVYNLAGGILAWVEAGLPVEVGP